MVTIQRVVRCDAVDLQRLAQFGREQYAATFGHLYSAEQLRQFFDDWYTAELFARWIDRREAAALFVATDADGAICGYCLCSRETDLPVPTTEESGSEIKRLYVAAAQRGSGLAARLLGAAVDWLRDAPLPPPIFLGVYAKNEPAARFYEKHGFREVGRYPFPTIAVEMRLMALRCPSPRL
jgi:ribosomal protein S18 acetylase RimI-like enzyme|eukprot:gene10397-7393_t